MSRVLPRITLLSVYKAFIRLHLDYTDVVYDQPNNESFCNKIESIQYNAALAITGAIHQFDTKIPRLIFGAWTLITLVRKLSGKFRSAIFT